ncbi:glycosyltransferase [Azospirillum endophyticum]
MHPHLAFTWQLTEIHGWGLVGVHTALHLVEQGRPPLLLERPLMSSLRPENREKLKSLVEPCERSLALAAQHPGRLLRLRDFDVLHALGNGFQAGPPSERFQGRRNIGVIAYEDTRFDAAVLERARRYERIIVHSTYNRQLLEAQGFTNIGFALQGIDEGELKVPPPSKRFGDRFVVFSGGKLEFRKGQDIVLTAFLRFQARHPDALLVTAWQNAWTEVGMTMAESPLASHPPRVRDNRIDIRRWAFENGADESNFLDLGFLGRHQIAGLLADCDAAVFPNRCEGATNLVAMEAMACGVPTILSANTGHMDLLVGDVCLTLDHQQPVPDRNGSRIGWGESSVDELVEQLEVLYTDRSGARARADRAQRFIRGERTWSIFAQAFVAAIEDSHSASATTTASPSAPASPPQTVRIQDALTFARDHQEAGRLAEAEDIYRRVLAVRPDLLAARSALAGTLLSQGRTAAALTLGRSVIALQPQAAESYADLATTMLGEGGGHLDASQLVRRAAMLDPKGTVQTTIVSADDEAAARGASERQRPSDAKQPPDAPLTIIYRVSQHAHDRLADTRRCLRNLTRTFAPQAERLAVVVGDDATGKTGLIEKEIAKLSAQPALLHQSGGDEAASWRCALDLALEQPDGAFVYFVEDGHLHLPDAERLLREGLEHADYVSLYDAPWQYRQAPSSTEPREPGSGRTTRLLLTPSSHWAVTTALTMTFAVRVGTLRQDREVFTQAAEQGPSIASSTIFAELAARGRRMLASIPGHSSRAEPSLLSPLVDWAAVAAACDETLVP